VDHRNKVLPSIFSRKIKNYFFYSEYTVSIRVALVRSEI